MESGSIAFDTSKIRAQVHELFSKLAPVYDLGNDLISFGLHRTWKRSAIAASGKLVPGAWMLDICTGTGDLAFLAKRMCPGADVTGLDFSESMLAVARKRVAKSSAEFRPGFVFGDATDLTGIPDSSVDLVTVAFGLRNIPERQKAEREVARVLRQDGAFVVLDLGRPVSPWLSPLFAFYFWIVMPIFSFFFTGDPKKYLWLIKSLKRFPRERELAAELIGSGFGEVEVRRFFPGAVSLHIARKRRTVEKEA
ncbi:MAG: ubiquinone/menaquinone biosynthesis methyltransferase [bacterium]|jgi:demethylmenaquinone methyltransferase/2-methoxy-6-polyprenyl-1,4-benzoquinol methylase